MSMMERVPSRILSLVLGTVVLAGWAISTSWSWPLAQGSWFWAAACLVGELLWVRLPVGQATVSMAPCVHFAALLILPRGQAMLIIAMTSLIAELGALRKPLVRAAFNAAQTALAVWAASLAVATASGGSVRATELLQQFRLWPLLLAAAVYFLVNTGAVSMAVALKERLPLARAWRANFGSSYELLSNGALFSLGVLLAARYVLSGMGGTILVALPFCVAYEGYRRYARARLGPQENTVRRAA